MEATKLRQQKSVVKPEKGEYIFCFLAYVVIADEQIDKRELDVIDQFIKEYNISSEKIDNSIKLILEDNKQRKSLNDIIQNLKKLDHDKKKFAVALSLQVVYSDGYYDPKEKDLITNLINELEIDLDDYDKLKELSVNSFQPDENTVDLHPIFKKYNSFFREMTNKLKDVSSIEFIIEKAEKMEKKLLLGGPKYTEIINKCADIASEDYNLIEKYINKNNNKLTKLNNNLKQIVKEVSKEQEVEEFDVKGLLTNLQEKVNKILIDRLSKNKESLYKKKRAMNNFTISFLGKTKAGKSTLHTVITGEGSEFIGTGNQRTTRYNRVYSWNNIRIIDTPGIAAPGGKSDEEIAESIVDESDIICYVVKNDSIQEAEFKFLKLIKEKNKPVIILLNVKENLRDERRLKVYLKDPLRWYKNKGKKSLQGHIDRIKKYTKKYYKNDYFKVYPVQLLAAQMSREEEYEEHSDTLYSSSQIQNFLDEIRISIIEEGILKRSQTMIDGTINLFNKTINNLDEFKKPIIEMKKKLSQKKNNFNNKLSNMNKKYNNSLNKAIKTEFNKLDDKAYDFAMKNYDKSEDDIKKEWQKYLRDVGFETGLKSAIERLITKYIEEVEEYLEEAIEDIVAFNKFELDNLDIIDADIGFNSFVKALFKGGVEGVIAGIIAAFTFSNPVGWFVGGIIGLAGLIKSIFKSKAKKRKEATEKLYNSLSEGIKKQKINAIKKVEKEFNEFTIQVENNIETYFKIMISNLEKVIGEIDPLVNLLQSQTREINKIFAWRILNYIKKKNKAPVKIDMQKVKDENINIKRKQGKEFYIKCNCKIEKDDIINLSSILQEDIKIERVKK